MASEIDLCNLALAELGDLANVSSITPPDDSPQAVYCSRFYPIARDALLELHDWNFASRRATLALVGDATTQTGAWCYQWLYAYAVPNGMVALRAIMDVQAPDDDTATMRQSSCYFGAAVPYAQPGQGIYTPQPFIVETLDTGALIVRTNQANAMARFTVKMTDPTKFSPLFNATLPKLLASFLAGPIVKGEEGIAVGEKKLQLALAMLSSATASDSNQRRKDLVQAVPWMVAR